MTAWSEGLDQKFDQMTSGSNDITGAYQLQQVIVIINLKLISNPTVKSKGNLDDEGFSRIFIILGLSTKIQWSDTSN